MDISKLNVTELESLAYRLIKQRDQASKDLAIVTNEIDRRKSLPMEDPAPKDRVKSKASSS